MIKIDNLNTLLYYFNDAGLSTILLSLPRDSILCLIDYFVYLDALINAIYFFCINMPLVIFRGIIFVNSSRGNLHRLYLVTSVVFSLT